MTSLFRLPCTAMQNCRISYSKLQAMVRTPICLLFQTSVQAWAPWLVQRQPRPLRSTLVQQIGVCTGREREERAARPSSCHMQAGWPEPLPSSWDQLGQNTGLCGAKAQGLSLGQKYSVNITIQSYWASGLLRKCQRHCTVRKISECKYWKHFRGINCAHAKKAGKFRSSRAPAGMSELLLVSKPV